MRQDYFIFLNILEEGLDYFLGLDLGEWWNLTMQGAGKLWIAGILFILALILVGGFFFWGLRFMAYCLVGSFVGLILVAGESPSMGTMTAAILYVTATQAAGNRKNYRAVAGSVLSILVLCGVLLVVSSQVGVPLLKGAFGDVMPLRTKIQKTSLVHVLNQLLPDELKFQDGTGEYEGGSLETQGRGPDFTGRTVITVESDRLPERPVYWARYKGNVYTGYSFNDSGDLEDPENPANIRYPDQVLADLAAFCEVNPREKAQEIRDFIVETLRSRTEYSLLVEAVPEGEDFIENFFFGQKKGYCIHYAAAAVMMFRMYGVPARYVTGFLIPPSMFYQNEEGIYQADVPDDHAHAWAEAYIDGRWMTVEATPPGGVPALGQEMEILPGEEALDKPSGAESVGESGSGNEAMPENGEPAKVKPEIMSVEAETMSGEVDETLSVVPENLAPSWIFLPVILILALLLILLGMFVRRFIVLDRRRRESVQEMFADTLEVLIQGGLSPVSSVLSEDLSEQILKCAPWVSEDEVRDVIEIVLRTTYGPRRATDDEWIRVQRLYYIISRHMGKELKGMAKFAFYMVDVWI